MDSCLLAGMCIKFHMNGKCTDGAQCYKASSHVPVLDKVKQTKINQWVEACRVKMKKKRAPPDGGGGGPPTKKQNKASTTNQYSVPLTSARLTAAEKLFIALPPTTDSPSPLSCRSASTVRTSPMPSPWSITGKPSTRTPVVRFANPPAAVTHADTPAVTHADTPAVTNGSTVWSPTASPLPVLPPNPFLPSIPLVVLAEMLESILQADQPECKPPLFQFEWSPEAAAHNLEVLRRHDFDLDAAIQSHPFCAVTIGSEFRLADLLAPLLDSHPLWSSFAERITYGSDYPLCPLDPADQQADLSTMLVRGNHKSANDNEELLTSMLQDEVVRAWQLPLPPVAAEIIPGAVVAQLGLVHQFLIDEHANQIDKYRLTHDQSFNIHRGTNRRVNDCLLVDELNPCRFGRAFIRLVHHIAQLRHWHPRWRILLTKVDCKSAYRRVHLAAKTTAVQAMVTIGGLLLVALRQTFGGAANPSQWSDISEVATDLANDLVRRRDWDPDSIATSPHITLLQDAHDADDRCDPAAPFVPASEIGVPYPPDDDPKFDCYIDDIFGAFLDADIARAQAVIPLVLSLLGRPVSTSESLPRDDLLSLKKFVAEALPSERKTILGWLVNTRDFSVALPHSKLVTWLRDLRKTIKKRGAHRKHLETLLGRLNHVHMYIMFCYILLVLLCDVGGI